MEVWAGATVTIETKRKTKKKKKNEDTRLLRILLEVTRQIPEGEASSKTKKLGDASEDRKTATWSRKSGRGFKPVVGRQL